MDPDLVGAPGVQLQTDQGTPPGAGQGLIPCAGVLAVGADHLLHQGALPGPQRGVYHTGGGLRPAVAHRQIDTAEGGGVELPLQHLLGVGVLGHCHQPGGPPVQPVDGVEISFNSL